VQHSHDEIKVPLEKYNNQGMTKEERLVDESQRRLSGKAALSSGYRLKLLVVLTLAVSVMGYIAFESTNFWPSSPGAKLSKSGCKRNHPSDADGAPICASVAASTNTQGFSHSPAIAANEVHSTDSIQGDAKNSRQSGRVNRRRDWYDDQSKSQDLRPGYTMAELCLTDLDDRTPRCQTGSYNKTFSLSESVGVSGSVGSVSEYTISGHVLTAEGLGLGGVTIVASPGRLKGMRIPDSERLRFWTLTDSLGAYSLDGIPDGEYTIRSGSQGPYRSARISARAGVDYADLVVSRDLATVAEGQVLTAEGEPLEGVTVLPVLLGQASVLTDDDGRFRLPVKLKPTISSFELRFQRPGYREQTGMVELQQLEAPNVAAVNVVMHPVESWTSVNGKVYSDSGEPLSGRTVELRPRSAQQTYRTTTDHQGQYTFTFVESSADYRLIVYGGADHKDYQQVVKVTADMDELDIVAESYEFGEVTGQLVNLNGVPVPDFDLVLRNTGSRRPNSLVSTDKHGNFEIPAAPAGEFVVASQSTPSILVQGLQLMSGDKLHLPLVLDWGEHEIRGVVVDAHGNPVPASRIVLQWSHQAEGITTSATRRTASDTQGYFAFSNLGPGPHSLQINAPGFPGVEINHNLSLQGYNLTVRLN
jgi:hypothetical protein